MCLSSYCNVGWKFEIKFESDKPQQPITLRALGGDVSGRL